MAGRADVEVCRALYNIDGFKDGYIKANIGIDIFEILGYDRELNNSENYAERIYLNKKYKVFRPSSWYLHAYDSYGNLPEDNLVFHFKALPSLKPTKTQLISNDFNKFLSKSYNLIANNNISMKTNGGLNIYTNPNRATHLNGNVCIKSIKSFVLNIITTQLLKDANCITTDGDENVGQFILDAIKHYI